jgi:hypothetical protein
MEEPGFDAEGLFNEDYLYFYGELLGDERSDADTELLWRLLELRPGMEVLDLASPAAGGEQPGQLADREQPPGQPGVQHVDAAAEHRPILDPGSAALGVQVTSGVVRVRQLVVGR